MKRITTIVLALILLLAIGLCALACTSSDKKDDATKTQKTSSDSNTLSTPNDTTDPDGNVAEEVSLPSTIEEAAARLEAAGYTVNVGLSENVGEEDTKDDTIVRYVEVRKNGNWALDLLLFKSKETAAAYYDKWEDNFRDHSLEGEIYGVIGEWTYSGIPEAFEAFKTPIKE